MILAAGASVRFGTQKLLHPLPDGDTLLERAIRAAGDYDAIVVCSSEVEPLARKLGARTMRNDEADRGMSHSLRLGNVAIDPARSIAVMPADLLLVEDSHITRMASLFQNFDVLYPSRTDGTPGHPVIFGPRARSHIASLRDNEPIVHLRDRKDLP